VHSSEAEFTFQTPAGATKVELSEAPAPLVKHGSN
jgi:hypothetical protein